jgi:hypothetical protein
VQADEYSGEYTLLLPSSKYFIVLSDGADPSSTATVLEPAYLDGSDLDDPSATPYLVSGPQVAPEVYLPRRDGAAAASVAGIVSAFGEYAIGAEMTNAVYSWYPSNPVLSYQWLRDGAVIAGATGASYVTTNNDAGAFVSVRVTGSRTGFASATATSQPVQVPILPPSFPEIVPQPVTTTNFTPTSEQYPSLTVGPRIVLTRFAPKIKVAGVTRAGKKIKVTVSSLPAGSNVSYRWTVGGTAIKSATKSSYTPAAKFRKKKLTVTVTVSGTGYATYTRTISMGKVK